MKKYLVLLIVSGFMYIVCINEYSFSNVYHSLEGSSIAIPTDVWIIGDDEEDILP